MVNDLKLKQYNCKFPNCDYSTNHRSQINYHHIIPRELNGSDKDFNRIWLCPTHHTKIYIPHSNGMHNIKGSDSIILVGWLSSTGGRVLEYKDIGGTSFYE
jgi:hypothetical protein